MYEEGHYSDLCRQAHEDRCTTLGSRYIFEGEDGKLFQEAKGRLDSSLEASILKTKNRMSPSIGISVR